ncbi:MAG: S1 RNA-binding domain-containing protein, partial [Gemmatimonadetes bacterium]|nr:S1 RNA-binding domain-containing protein [Gemmatimonadota bacterium]
GIDGLIHISDMSWTKRVQHPSEVVTKADEVEVVILNIDPDNKRISLGLKQAQEDPWLKIGEQYPVGMELKGKVVRFQDGGVVVDLGDDLEGIVRKTDLGLPDESPVEEQVQLGQHVALTIVEVDPIHHRVLVSAREFLDQVDPPAAPPPSDGDNAEKAAPSTAGAAEKTAAEAPPAEQESPAEDAPAEPDADEEAAKAAAEDAPAEAEPDANDEPAPAAAEDASAEPEPDADEEAAKAAAEAESAGE